MNREQTCLLLRTHRFGDMEQAFLTRLKHETGFRVAVAADENVRPLDCGSFPKVSVTRQAARQLGLYCTRDFTWRCGDYGLYLARAAMPDIEHFWQIEPDVRAAFASYQDLFRIFDPYPEIDLIAFDLRTSDPDHWWHATMRQRTRDVYRCLFGLTRFSARALDVCCAERRRDLYNPWARLTWPNDETFTATILAAAGLAMRDANEFGRQLYTRETFCYSTLFRGEDFENTAQTGLVYHPVLWGDDYQRRMVRLHSSPRFEHLRMRLLKAVMIEDNRRRLRPGHFLAGQRRPARPKRPVSDAR